LHSKIIALPHWTIMSQKVILLLKLTPKLSVYDRLIIYLIAQRRQSMLGIYLFEREWIGTVS
jgi:hypothetical protein